MKKILSLIALALAVVLGALFAPELTVNLLTVAAVSAGAVYVVANHHRTLRRSRLASAVNTLAANWGTVSNGKTFISSAAIGTRFLLGKFGADFTKVAVIAAASDEPICVITDEASAAGEELFGELLGLTNRTVPVVVATAITLGADLYSDGTGKVTVKPTAAGTYWRVGKALQPADADGDVIEMLPQRPRKLIVVSALDSTNGTFAGAADLAAAKAEGEKVGDDLRKIAAGLAADADVALATT